MGSCENDRKLLKSYFRYHHFFTYATKKGHVKYLQNLDFLEGLMDFIVDYKTENLKETWKNILMLLNKLNCSQVEEMYKKTKS